MNSSDCPTSKSPTTMTDTSRLDILRARQQYAWQWFDFHAKQRTTIFNYFLIAATLVVSAYAQLITHDFYGLAAFLSALGASTSVCFLGLEYRNVQLVRWGERLLIQSERNFLFGTITSDNKAVVIQLETEAWQCQGILSVEEDLKNVASTEENFDDDGKFLRKDGRWKYHLKNFGLECFLPISHGFWFPRMIVGTTIMFVILCLFATLNWIYK